MKLLRNIGAAILAFSAFQVNAQTTVTFGCTGAPELWTVPPCVTELDIVMAGGEGGGPAIDGGNGAVVTGTITVTPGQVLEINVGCQGTCPGVGGAFLGGGAGSPGGSGNGCSGGGASSIEVSPYTMGDALAVASGGGGMGGGTTTATGGAGGCASGSAGSAAFGGGGAPGTAASGGGGGTPWAGLGEWGSAGGLGFGGAAAPDLCYGLGPGGGGGGGYYGGGGGGSDCWPGGWLGGGGGGGGSSLTPAGGGCTPGTNTGDGYIEITYVPAAPEGGDAEVSPDAVCFGDSTNLTLTGYFGDIVWEYAPTPAGPFIPMPTDTLDDWWYGPVNADMCFRAAVTSCGTTVYSDTTCVTMKPIPAVWGGLDVEVCDGTEVTLTADNPDGATISWDGGITDGVGFVQPVGTVTYTVTATLDGCDSTDQVDVWVKPYPIISAGPDFEVCIGDDATLTADNPDGAIISWSGGISDGVPFTMTATGFFDYTVTADLIGCISTDMVVIEVNPLPVVDAGPNQTVCEGEEVILSGSGCGPGGSYVWDLGVTNGIPFNPPVGVTTTYTVIGTDTNSCSNMDNVNVTVIANPIVAFSGDDLLGCEPHTVNFTNLTTPEGIECVWNWGDGTFYTGCDSAYHEFEQDGEYDVTLTVTIDGGCTSTVTYENYVEVIAMPIAAYTYSSDGQVTIEDPIIIFTNQSLFATDYKWKFGDGSPYSTDLNVSHAFPDLPNEDYDVTLWAYNELGCVDSVTKKIYVNDVITFYIPNIFTPDGDTYNETFKPQFYSGFNPYDFSLKIYNRWGEIMFETRNAEVGWDGTYGSIGLVEDGTYIWYLEFQESGTEKRHKHRGHVTILK